MCLLALNAGGVDKFVVKCQRAFSEPLLGLLYNESRRCELLRSLLRCQNRFWPAHAAELK